MMIPIIYINPNGSGIGGKAIVPPLVVFHLRVGDSMFLLSFFTFLYLILSILLVYISIPDLRP